MSERLSVAEILANLEGQMAHHQQQQAFHTERETFHREQAAVHAAEHEVVARHYEAFKATARAAAEIAARTASPVSEDPLPHGKAALRSRLVARVMEELPAGETFTASRLAAEVNRRFGKTLRKPVNTRLVSAALRRKLANGTIRLVQPGAARREAVYTRA